MNSLIDPPLYEFPRSAGEMILPDAGGGKTNMPRSAQFSCCTALGRMDSFAAFADAPGDSEDYGPTDPIPTNDESAQNTALALDGINPDGTIQDGTVAMTTPFVPDSSVSYDATTGESTYYDASGKPTYSTNDDLNGTVTPPVSSTPVKPVVAATPVAPAATTNFWDSLSNDLSHIGGAVTSVTGTANAASTAITGQPLTTAAAQAAAAKAAATTAKPAVATAGSSLLLIGGAGLLLFALMSKK